MSIIEFNSIKNNTGFRTCNGKSEQQIKICEERIEAHGISIGNKVMELVTKYGNFYIDRNEDSSGDRLRFYYMPLFNPSLYWSEFDQNAAFIGEIVNSDCRNLSSDSAIESAYLLNDGCYYNQLKKKIANNDEELFDYFMRSEYNYHATVPQETYIRLKSGGWFKGRKANISKLIEECQDNGIILSNVQKSFLEEFSGIVCTAHNGQEVEIFSKLSHGICQVNANSDDYDEKWIYDNYDKNAVCVGICFNGEGTIWLTSAGQMLLKGLTGVLKDDNWVSMVGRTIIGGFNVLLG